MENNYEEHLNGGVCVFKTAQQMCSNCQDLRDEGKGYKPDLMGRRRLTGGPEQLLPTAVFC